MTQRPDNATLRRARGREEGLVMLIVLLVIGMVTATGLFALKTSTLELRASGHVRRGMQTEYVADGMGQAAVSAVFAMGTENLLAKLRRDRAENSDTAVSVLGLEPEYTTNQQDVGRLNPTDLALVGANATTTDMLGPHEPSTAVSWVDINDVYVTQLNRAGERAGDGAPAVQMHIVYTARTRLRHNATGTVDTDTSSLDYGRQRGEVVGASRFFALQTDYPSGRL